MPAPCLCGSSSCPLSAPPGSSSIWGDSSRAFSRDPLAFLEAQAHSLGSRVFLTRLALKQTLVIADHALLTTFLREHMEDFYNGLTSHLSDLFGHNIMFAAPAEAAELRAVLLPLFRREGGGERGEVLARILGGWRDGLDTARTVNFYDEMKAVSLEYNLETFMGVQRTGDEEFFKQVSSLATSHWHGMTAVPLAVPLPGWGGGAYRKAIDAKEKLLKIIREKLDNNNSEFFHEFQAKNDSVMDRELLYNHMLLFSCALIPKGVASVLSMFFEMSPRWRHLQDPEGRLGEEELEWVLLEVMRMFPPFTGGLRVAARDTQVGPYHLPSGTPVYYSLHSAMRDPTTFLEPDQFLPGRWREKGGRERNLAFSTGPHDCIGRHFTMACIRQMSSFILKEFLVSSPPSCPPDIKQIPVLRPKHPTLFTLVRKTS